MEDVELKSAIGDFVNSISKLLKLSVKKKLVDTTVKDFYQKGFENVEIQFDVNLPQNSSEVAFLKEYTFDNIKNLDMEMRDKLRKTLSDGLMNNKSRTEMIREVNNILDISKNRAKMIVRTETNRIFNAGRQDAAEKTGFKLKKYVSVQMDDRTSPICSSFYRKYGTPDKAIPLKQKFKDTKTGKTFDIPPFHVNCRSRALYVPV